MSVTCDKHVTQYVTFFYVHFEMSVKGVMGHHVSPKRKKYKIYIYLFNENYLLTLISLKSGKFTE